MPGKLFQPIKIGSVTVPNRVAMAPMAVQYAETTGEVTQRQIEYYVERARNRVGLIIVEATCVAPGGRMANNQACIYDDSFVPGLSRLAAAIKGAGARAFIQIHHAGRRAYSKDNQGVTPVAPSAIPTRTGEMPRALSLDEIEVITEAFARGALRAQQAGFDGVELHFAHSYLAGQFFSPLTNKRTDRYGGDLTARARFGVEVIRRIKERVGADYPVSARICGDEYIRGGLGPAESRKLAVILQDAGLDAINVSAGYTASHEEGYLGCQIPGSSAPMSWPDGCYLHLGEGMKKVLKVPVMTVGRLGNPLVAEEAVAGGKTDMVVLGRSLLADPAWAAKVYEGRDDEIRRCMACSHCQVTIFTQGNVSCAINAETGREAEYRIAPAARRKRVVVIGGGPGGMEAARVAALRGHKVTLLEKKSELGGSLNAASTPSFKREIALFTKYLTKAIQKAGVEVKLNTGAGPEQVLSLKPDTVIIAAGATPVIPEIPGVNGKNVTDAVSVLEGRVKTGHRVVVAGGGAVGCEVAAFLAEAGKQVTIVEMRDTDYSAAGGLGPDMEPALKRWFNVEFLPTLSIDVIGRSTFREVTAGGLVVEDREGQRRLVPGDTVVFAAGMKPNNGLKAKLDGKVAELYEVGDCVNVAHIIDAVQAAAKVTRQI